jgi:oxaloacetate decarboxylase alpha subunit
MPDLADLRERFGKHLDDEEFVLRAVMPAAQIDAMLAAPPVRRTYEPSAKPIMTLLRELAKRPAVGSLRVEKPNFSLELTRRS